MGPQGPRHAPRHQSAGSLLDRAGHERPRPSRSSAATWTDCRNFLGPNDPITLDAAERLGSILWHLGKLDEAEAVLRKNVDDRGRVLQPEHADTLRSIYLLSRLLRDRRRFDEAEHLAYRLRPQRPVRAGLATTPTTSLRSPTRGTCPRPGQARPGRAVSIARPPSRPAASSVPSTNPLSHL